MQNGIMDEGGLAPFDTELPKEQLAGEKEMAKFAKSREFKKLQEHLESRIQYYQAFLPDGRPVEAVSQQERVEMWPVANAIIKELGLIINAYEQAAEAVKDATRKNG